MAMTKTELKGAIGVGLIGDIMNVGFAISDFNHAREQGNNVAVSAAKAAGSFAWGEFYYGGLSSVMERSIVGKSIAAIPLAGLKGTILKGALNLGAIGVISSIPALAKMSAAMYEHTGREMSKAYGSVGKIGSGYFEMTEAGYTMRQRSLNAIRNNGLNTQSVLGNEARTYYRSSL